MYKNIVFFRISLNGFLCINVTYPEIRLNRFLNKFHKKHCLQSLSIVVGIVNSIINEEKQLFVAVRYSYRHYFV